MSIHVFIGGSDRPLRYLMGETEARPKAALVPGITAFQDIGPDGSVGPVWSLDDVTWVGTEAGNLIVRFPDGTELTLVADPVVIATFRTRIASAADVEPAGEEQAVSDGDAAPDPADEVTDVRSDDDRFDLLDELDFRNGTAEARFVAADDPGFGGNAGDAPPADCNGRGCVADLLAVIQGVAATSFSDAEPGP